MGGELVLPALARRGQRCVRTGGQASPLPVRESSWAWEAGGQPSPAPDVLFRSFRAHLSPCPDTAILNPLTSRGGTQLPVTEASFSLPRETGPTIPSHKGSGHPELWPACSWGTLQPVPPASHP